MSDLVSAAEPKRQGRHRLGQDRVTLYAYIERDQFDRILAYARAEDLTISQVVRRALGVFLPADATETSVRANIGGVPEEAA